jgi:hypothetical protein
MSQIDAYWSEGSDEAFKVELENGAELTGSHRHPMWVCFQSNIGEYGFAYKSCPRSTTFANLDGDFGRL